MPPDSGSKQSPIPLGLRVLVVCEADVGTYEHVILDGDAGRDENERTDLAIISNSHALFDVHVGVDLGILPNLTSVEIHEVVNSGVLSNTGFLDNGKFWGFPHLTRTSSATGNCTWTVRS